jgi:hypothetical protein
MGGQHGVLPLKEGDDRFDGRQVAAFERQELLDFSAPGPPRCFDPAKRLLQSGS